MKYSLLTLLILATIIFACNKDKFTTEPQVKITAISPNEVSHGDNIRIRGSFTDDEGDMDSVYIIRKWFNGDLTVRVDTFKSYTITQLSIPGGTRQGDLEINFSFGLLGGQYPTLPNWPLAKDTTSSFGIIMKDMAGHSSNYAESDKVRLKKP